jgi:hypothetical protein
MLKCIAECFDGEDQSCIDFGQDNLVTDNMSVAEYRADFIRGRKMYGKNYEMMALFLNGEL